MNRIILIFTVVLLASCQRPVREGGVIEKNQFITENPEKIIPAKKQTDSLSGKIALTGKITRIVDGDTAELLYNGELPIKIRLQHIDAPEKRGKQPYGNKAKQILSDLCFGQEVTIITDGDFDMGGRLIGEIINENQINVNKEMVRLGYAWHFKKYSDDLSYQNLEQEARKNGRGLWQESNPIAPWDFR